MPTAELWFSRKGPQKSPKEWVETEGIPVWEKDQSSALSFATDPTVPLSLSQQKEMTCTAFLAALHNYPCSFQKKRFMGPTPQPPKQNLQIRNLEARLVASSQ